MPDSLANSKRIAKNTLFLYVRMLFTMAISLYTSRIVLSILGVEDYGIYNVVGGVVAMFGFINSAMATGTQRYLTFELGKGNFLQLQKVFSTSLIIHLIISIIIVFLSETIGLWFLYYKMIIPVERITAAFWVFQFSVLSSVVLIMSVPYNAAIIAHEKMSAFAYISIMEVTLKLVIVFILQVGHQDKLILYGFLLLIVQVGVRFIYGFYCEKNFKETKFHFILDRSLFKEMLSFSSWHLCGSGAVIAYTQGLNLLLNVFFGPSVNAARGVAVQVQQAITQFSHSFQTAINPQITKSYAVHDYKYMHNLIFKSSKYTFYLLLLLSLPVFFETKFLLSIWLKVVPEYSVVFLRLMLCIAIIDAVANPFMISASATGKVRRYQLVVGGILLTIIPISYISLRVGANPYSVFIVHLIVAIIAFYVRLLMIRPMINMSLSIFYRQVICRCLKVNLMAVILPICLTLSFDRNAIISIVNCFLCFFSVLFAVYFCGLESTEKQLLKQKLLDRLLVRNKTI